MNAPSADFLDGRVSLYVGDCVEQMAAMEADSVDCVVTSPPYWGLRDYGVDGQIGLEPTLGEHLDAMVRVFEEVRRILKPTGTLWINYGDCYATTPNGRTAAETKEAGTDDRTFRDKPFSTVGPIRSGAPMRSGRSQNKGNVGSDGVRRNFAGEGYLKPKDLCMIPNRLAIVLQDAGWWVRSEIVWGKNNPMPDSSGAYRPSTSHEKIFLLTKSADADVWRARDSGEISFNPDLTERCPLVTRPEKLAARWVRTGHFYDAEIVTIEASPNTNARVSQDVANQVGSYRANGGTKTNGTMKAVVRDRKQTEPGSGTKNNSSFNEAMVLQPARRYLRNYEPAPVPVWPMSTQPFSDAHFATFPPELAERCILAGCPKGGLVLDPFGGAGTTALVALRHNRRAALIELNHEYAAMARRRIEAEWRVQPVQKSTDHGPLFGGLTGEVAA
jgi:DNA modification methylase